MREDQIDQAERQATLENDLKVLQQQGSTFHQHGISQADETNQGRFRSTGAPKVIGSTPAPASQYPAASAAHQTELPSEEPLGYAVDEMISLENPVLESAVSSSLPAAQDPDDPADAPLHRYETGGPAPDSAAADERAGSSPHASPAPPVSSIEDVATRDDRAGLAPTRRTRRR